MKNLLVFTFTILASTAAFGQGIKRYVCSIKQPCEHSDSRLLGSCLNSVELYFGPQNSALALSNHSSTNGQPFTVTSSVALSLSNETLFLKSLPGFFAALDRISPTQYRAIFTVRSNFSFQGLCSLDPATKF